MRAVGAFLVASLAACSAAKEPAAVPAPIPVPEEPVETEDPQAPEEPEEPRIPGGGPDPMTLTGDHSTSIGGPVTGRLEGGAPLPLHGKGYRFGRGSRNPDKRHGTVELVQALVRAAAAVDDKVPGGQLTINDLSLASGGEIGGHASHRAGRDVDVLFFLLDEDDKPFGSKAIPLEPDGTGVDYQDLAVAEDDVPVKLDVPRTWAFVEALVSDEDARVNKILVVEHVRSILLEYAKSSGAPKAAIDRFAELTCQPRFPHDDHFHIRVYCTPQDIKAGCEDTRPIFPSQQKLLKAAGVKAKIEGRPKKKRKKLTSVAEARKKAEKKGTLHKDVTDFLDRRKEWAKKPHPGRKYCK